MLFHRRDIKQFQSKIEQAETLSMAENTPVPLFFPNTSRNEMIVTQAAISNAASQKLSFNDRKHTHAMFLSEHI